MVFRMYGLVCAVMLVIFTVVNFFNMKEGGFSTELGRHSAPWAYAKGEPVRALASL